MKYQTPVWVQLMAWEGLKRYSSLREEALFIIEANIRDQPWFLCDSGKVNR